MVINVPTGERGWFFEHPSISKLISISNIVATFPKILSNRFEGALRMASLSTYSAFLFRFE